MSGSLSLPIVLCSLCIKSGPGFGKPKASLRGFSLRRKWLPTQLEVSKNKARREKLVIKYSWYSFSGHWTCHWPGLSLAHVVPCSGQIDLRTAPEAWFDGWSKGWILAWSPPTSTAAQPHPTLTHTTRSVPLSPMTGGICIWRSQPHIGSNLATGFCLTVSVYADVCNVCSSNVHFIFPSLIKGGCLQSLPTVLHPELWWHVLLYSGIFHFSVLDLSHLPMSSF